MAALAAARWKKASAEPSEPSEAPVPFAKWRGQLDLGGAPVECYVLDNGERVIATRSAIKAFADADSGNLGNYIGVGALKPFVDSELVLGELIEFGTTEKLFTAPQNKRTEEYITGRFG